jgi:Xaa-Pro aminopeptidase
MFSKDSVIDHISPGVTERELNDVYFFAVIREGSYFVNALIGGGTRADVALAPGWLPSKEPLKKGDMVRMDCYHVYENYISDVARTAVIGSPGEKLKRYCDALVEGHKEAFNMIAPGKKASEIFYSAMEKIKEGIPHYKRPHLGHSTGVKCYNPLLSFSPQCNVVLQENMVINFETPYYELGFGGINIEEPILVTKNDYKDLTSRLGKNLHIL